MDVVPVEWVGDRTSRQGRIILRDGQPDGGRTRWTARFITATNYSTSPTAADGQVGAARRTSYTRLRFVSRR